MTATFYITTKANALMPREAVQLVTKNDFRSKSIHEAAVTINATLGSRLSADESARVPDVLLDCRAQSKTGFI